MVDRLDLVVRPLSVNLGSRGVYFKRASSPKRVCAPEIIYGIGMAICLPYRGLVVVGDIPRPTTEDMENYRVPYLKEAISLIPKGERREATVILTGTTYPMNGDPLPNFCYAVYQTAFQGLVESILQRRGFEKRKIQREYSPPNTITSLAFDTSIGLVDISRVDVINGEMTNSSRFI